jgi:hypothetical protein
MRKENMPVSQILTVTKTDLVFSSADEAIDAFKSDNPRTSQESFNQSAQDSGDLVQLEAELTENKDGYIFNRTWSDAKWEEKTASGTNELSDNDNNPVSLSESINGWTKKLELSYSS